MDEMTFTLHNPLTEEEWDIIEDVDFDHTNSITFHTKHGKEVEFVKCKTGRWITHKIKINEVYHSYCECTVCGHTRPTTLFPLYYCPNCGADMREVTE